MRLPTDVIIATEKIIGYLLVFQKKSDKSKFLLKGGFTPENPEALEIAIRDLITNTDAEYNLTNQFGSYYTVTGDLIGVNGQNLGVVTVWIIRKNEDVYRFVTLKPSK